jgi:hypothetical protein
LAPGIRITAKWSPRVGVGALAYAIVWHPDAVAGGRALRRYADIPDHHLPAGDDDYFADHPTLSSCPICRCCRPAD